MIGYIVAELQEKMIQGFSQKKFSGRILNTAVQHNFRRKKVATQLMTETIAKMRKFKAEQLTLKVRESNQSARSFYKHLCFKEEGRIPNYYVDEDAIMMKKEI